MRNALKSRVGAVFVIGGATFLVSCSLTSRPQAYRTFFLPPPAHAASASQYPLIEPPDSPGLSHQAYTSEVPALTSALPAFARPSDADFLLKRAEDRFAEGKRAIRDGKQEDARRAFDRAVELLLGAPENLPERARIERRLEEMVEEIYRYDVDQSTPADSDDKVVYDKAPLEGILEMTFPVDPSLRSKIKEQIQATVSQLPLQENDAVIGAVNFFSSTRGKRIIAAGLRRQGKYKALIERILTEEGLPQELIFVAQEESGYLPRAMSNKKCVGLWQFAKFRGNEYGLMQTPSTDDRMDPEKATRAAARHLRDLYTHFGDWYLALAAYDCGPGCVDRAVMRTGYADFFELRRLNALPKETANYVPVILAMTIIAKNAKDYGLEDLDLDRPLEYDTIELQTSTHVGLIADAVERPLSELKGLNPALLKSVAPAGFAVRIPKGTAGAVESAYSAVPPNKRDSWRLHRVEPGDTFAGLAKRYRSTAASVASVNHQELPDPGAWVAIPTSYPGERPAMRTASSARKTLANKTPARKGVSTRAATSTRAHASTGTTPRRTAHKKLAAAAQKSAAKAAVHRAAAVRTPAS